MTVNVDETLRLYSRVDGTLTSLPLRTRRTVEPLEIRVSPHPHTPRWRYPAAAVAAAALLVTTAAGATADPAGNAADLPPAEGLSAPRDHELKTDSLEGRTGPTERPARRGGRR